MSQITRLAGALRPREISDGAGQAANPPHQGKILDLKMTKIDCLIIKLYSDFNPDKRQGHPRTKTLPAHLPP